MVEYSLDEAEKLLNKNLSNASQNVGAYEDDLSYLKDQITTCEVNIARVHNYGVSVKQVQEQKDQKTN